MGRARELLARYGLDLTVCAAAVWAAFSTAAPEDLAHPDGPLLWLEVVAVTAVVLTLMARRRLPFAAPASTWPACGALSFLDGGLRACRSPSCARPRAAWRTCSCS